MIRWDKMPCVDCGIVLMPATDLGHQDWERYMVHDDVWAAVGMEPNGGWMCISCLEARLGRRLTGADLKDLPINDPRRDDDTPRLAALKTAAAWRRSNPLLRERLARTDTERQATTTRGAIRKIANWTVWPQTSPPADGTP